MENKLEIPENVKNHTIALILNVKPQANWGPGLLRDHADTKEYWSQFIKKEEVSEEN